MTCDISCHLNWRYCMASELTHLSSWLYSSMRSPYFLGISSSILSYCQNMGLNWYECVSNVFRLLIGQTSLRWTQIRHDTRYCSLWSTTSDIISCKGTELWLLKVQKHWASRIAAHARCSLWFTLLQPAYLLSFSDFRWQNLESKWLLLVF